MRSVVAPSAARSTFCASGNAMRTVSLRLPDELERRVAALAKRRRTSRSEVIRAALEAFEPPSAPSFTASAADLLGTVDGPKHLSSAPRCTADYGK